MIGVRYPCRVTTWAAMRLKVDAVGLGSSWEPEGKLETFGCMVSEMEKFVTCVTSCNRGILLYNKYRKTRIHLEQE